jgi:hypothetical protein
MSGLARGRAPWVMKSSFIVRGLSAIVLVAALPEGVRTGVLAVAGVVLLWLWGLGSAALALVDTDMPGEARTPVGAAHALIALAAYIAGVVGAIALSYSLLRSGLTGIAQWSLPIAVIAAVAVVVQFVAFWAAAREAQVAAPGAIPAHAPSAPGFTSARPAAATPAPSVAVPPQLIAVPPQLGAPPVKAAGQPPVAGVARQSPEQSGLLGDLAAYAGLYQRMFVGLLMLWTLLMALNLL